MNKKPIEKIQLIAKAKQLVKIGMNRKEIANDLGVAVHTVGRWYKRLNWEKEIMDQDSINKIFDVLLKLSDLFENYPSEKEKQLPKETLKILKENNLFLEIANHGKEISISISSDSEDSFVILDNESISTHVDILSTKLHLNPFTLRKRIELLSVGESFVCNISKINSIQ